jgi:hypothetical protein
VGVAGTVVGVAVAAGCCCVAGVEVGGWVVGVAVGAAAAGVEVAAGAVVAWVTGVVGQGPWVASAGRACATAAGMVMVCPAMQYVTVPGVCAEAFPVEAVNAPIAAMSPMTATAETWSSSPYLLLGRCNRARVASCSMPSPP